MNKPRSPIERMIDEACGLSLNDPLAAENALMELRSKALLEIADAAKVWYEDRVDGETRLTKAVEEWIKLGG